MPMGKESLAMKRELWQIADSDKAEIMQRFFKTGRGEYAEGDVFLGVTVPKVRQLVKKYWRNLETAEIVSFLQSRYHEERLMALFVFVAKFEKKDEASQKEIFDLYLANTEFINNWDLVDLSAPNIVGAYLLKNRDRAVLRRLARSKILWERRIAMLATFCFIKEGEATFALEIAEILVNDRHDLIQKAVGWMLRETGKRCGQDIEEEFLKKYYKTMPRTMLRYAIERFDAAKRDHYLGRVK